jgi:hypothetical protein
LLCFLDFLIEDEDEDVTGDELSSLLVEEDDVISSLLVSSFADDFLDEDFLDDFEEDETPLLLLEYIFLASTIACLYL